MELIEFAINQKLYRDIVEKSSLDSFFIPFHKKQLLHGSTESSMEKVRQN